MTITRLFGGAPVGTEAGDRLAVLFDLVEQYEAKRWPINVPDPRPRRAFDHAGTNSED